MQEAAAGMAGSSVGRGEAGSLRSYRAPLLCFGHWHCTASGSPEHWVILCSYKSLWPGGSESLEEHDSKSDAIRITCLIVQLFFPSFRGLR